MTSLLEPDDMLDALGELARRLNASSNTRYLTDSQGESRTTKLPL